MVLPLRTVSMIRDSTLAAETDFEIVILSDDQKTHRIRMAFTEDALDAPIGILLSVQNKWRDSLLEAAVATGSRHANALQAHLPLPDHLRDSMSPGARLADCRPLSSSAAAPSLRRESQSDQYQSLGIGQWDYRV